MQPNLPAVKTAAMRLVRALGPADQAEIIQFNHKFTVLQDFTNDQAKLETAVRGITADGATGLYNALYFTLKDPRFRRKSDDLTRQAVVILSDGEDTYSLVSDDQVLELARKGNVTIFPISLRAPRTSTFDTEAPDRAVFFLSALARETGGRSYFPNGLAQIDGVYDKIADELRTQYALGYVSRNHKLDGKWRRIAIETNQGTGCCGTAGLLRGRRARCARGRGAPPPPPAPRARCRAARRRRRTSSPAAPPRTRRESDLHFEVADACPRPLPGRHNQRRLVRSIAGVMNISVSRERPRDRAIPRSRPAGVASLPRPPRGGAAGWRARTPARRGMIVRRDGVPPSTSSSTATTSTRPRAGRRRRRRRRELTARPTETRRRRRA
jgi:hypothetical protein